jgi:hypothetical protein
MTSPANRPETVDAAAIARTLAEKHDAATLAAALVTRLRAESRVELATAVTALFAATDAALLDPTPPNPHKGAEAGIIDPTPPYPREKT